MAASDSYIPLAGNTPLGDPISTGNLSLYLDNMFKLGVGVAIGLAVLMIVLGGIQYMSTDAMGGKEEGKDKVTQALWGLLIVLISVLVLNTINPRLLDTKLKIDSADIDGVTPTYTTVNPGQPGYPYQPGDMNYGQPTFLPNSDAAQRILQSAQYAADPAHPLNTCTPDTENGRFGCAYAVNQIVENALGQPVGGGLSTRAMYNALQTNNSFVLVGSDLRLAQPGDIIISPTEGSTHGHVGIAETPGATTIISNSSSGAEVRRNYTASSWLARQNSRGLDTYIYRAK